MAFACDRFAFARREHLDSAFCSGLGEPRPFLFCVVIVQPKIQDVKG